MRVYLFLVFCLLLGPLAPAKARACFAKGINSSQKLNHRIFQVQEVDIAVAQHKKELSWGLMGKKKLLPNQGLLFDYGKFTTPSIWSFNTFVDLDVAFIDAKNQISKIQHLKVYPEQMHKLGIFKSLKEIEKIPPHHPILQFFRKKSVKAPHPCRYILEMAHGWFEDHGIEEGDTLHWEVCPASDGKLKLSRFSVTKEPTRKATKKNITLTL